MGRRNKGRGSNKKKRGRKSKQITPKNNHDGAPHNTTTTPALTEVSEDELPILRFNIGDRVDCHVNENTWEPGTIVRQHCFGDDGAYRPYGIRLDNALENIGCLICAPYDEDDWIKNSNVRLTLRFIVGDRVECCMGGDNWETGTIVMRNYHYQHVDGECISPYGVRLDNGDVVSVPADDDLFVRKSLDIMDTFKVGSSVELLEDGEWKSGTIVHSTPNWIDVDPLESAPYTIQLDAVDQPQLFWGPRDSIREIQVATSVNDDAKTLRFSTGDRVECNIGVGGRWMPGTIIKTHYKESGFEAGFTAPYQIRLDIGNLIYAPADNDNSIKKFDAPAPTCWICFDDEQTEENPIVRECACRGEENGYVHINCLAKLAITKVTNNENYKEGIDDENPFTQCITCKQEFKKGSYSFSAIASELYDSYGGLENIGGPYFGIATSMTGQFLMTRSMASAEKFLVERCNIIVEMISREIKMQITNSQLDLDLTRIYGDLALVYEEMGDLDNMKIALDQSLPLIKALEDGSHSRRKINIHSSLANHAYLMGDLSVAIERYGKCTSLTSRQGKENDMLLASLLIKSGNIELELGNTEWGIEKISESMGIMTRVYGRDHVLVGKMARCLNKIQGGVLEVMPKTVMGLDFSALPDF